MLSLLVFNKVNRLEIQLVKLVFSTPLTFSLVVKVGPPVHNYEHEAGSYGDGFT
jgi:hypothetical protein